MKIPVFVTDHPFQWKAGVCTALTLDCGWEGFVVGVTDGGFVVQNSLTHDLLFVPHDGDEWFLVQDSDEYRRIYREFMEPATP
jgi:hypothetical protein